MRIMKKIKVLQGQTLLDIAVSRCGTADSAVQIALLNDLNLTDPLTPGMLLEVPAVVNIPVAQVFDNKTFAPATGLEAYGRIFDYTFDKTFN